MTGVRPTFTSVDLWRREHDLIIDTLRRALVLLLTKRQPNAGENDLNRLLYYCLSEARGAMKRGGVATTSHTPIFDARHSPDPSTDDTPAEFKRPDIRYEWYDDLNEDEVLGVHIECKRLEPKSNAGWEFIRHYVEDGVVRFIDENFHYGRKSPAGVMVGYVSGMSQNDALSAVNGAISTNGKIAPQLVALSSSGEYEHTLTRSFPVTSFRLGHFWVGP